MEHELAGLPARLANRFVVERQLGQGSLARVVSAFDEISGSRVAIKVLHASLRADAAVVDRFRREVEIVRRVDHPHVIRTHGLFEDGSHLCLVMDLHEGGDLADLLARRGPLPEARLAALVAQICGALDAAHRASVVHRDLKPQNVLVGQAAWSDSGTLDVRLADFGLARTADLAGLTTRTTVLGTPEYMAPEVISDGDADPRSDVYSLGVVLFEAATGKLPFAADSPYEMLRHHLSTPAPRARDVRPDVPGALDLAIARALEKDPLDRPPSAAAFAEACFNDPATTRVALTLCDGTAAKCQRCGAGLVASSNLCIECRSTRLSLGYQRGGQRVLVTGPGEPMDKLDGASHVALVQLLEELPTGSVSLRALRRKPPRLPFLVASELDRTSARALCERLIALGFVAKIIEKSLLGPREILWKIWRQGAREFLAVAGSAYLFMNPLPRLHPVLFGIFPVLYVAPFVRGALTYPRPLARRLSRDRGGNGVLDPLVATLGQLERRSDRRLVARLVERLEGVVSVTDPETCRPIAARAAGAAQALVALEARAKEETALAGLATRQSPPDALERAREDERLRAALRADLLRTLGHIEEASARLRRARALDGALDTAQAVKLLSDASAEIAAEEELATLLGGQA